MTGFFAAAFHFRHSVTFPAGCLTKLALDCNRALSVSSQKCHIQTVLYNQSKRDVSFEQADKSKLTASRKTRRFFGAFFQNFSYSAFSAANGSGRRIPPSADLTVRRKAGIFSWLCRTQKIRQIFPIKSFLLTAFTK